MSEHPTSFWVKPKGLEILSFSNARSTETWSAPLPRFSWIGRPELSTVSDQKPPHQTCFSHALCRALETRRAVAKAPQVRLDADMFHSCILGLPCGVGENDPAHIAGAIENPGAPRLLAAYDCGDPCPDPFPPLTASVRVKQVNSASDAKTALRAYWPLVANISAETRFEQVSDFSIYRDGQQSKIYHHALLLVGYDDIAGCWEVQNSYGTNWGSHGRGRIAYGHASVFADENHVAFLVT